MHVIAHSIALCHYYTTIKSSMVYKVQDVLVKKHCVLS